MALNMFLAGRERRHFLHSPHHLLVHWQMPFENNRGLARSSPAGRSWRKPLQFYMVRKPAVDPLTLVELTSE